jgi:hypothetical protein
MTSRGGLARLPSSSPRRIQELLDKHPRPSLPNASFDEDADIYKKLKAALDHSNPDG